MSAAEIRALARAISGGGVEADARAVGQTGATHVLSIAELERDIGVIAPKWTGEAAEESYLQAGRFVRSSAELGLEFGRTVKQLTGLSRTAYTTNQRFSDLADYSERGSRSNDRVGARVAAELRSMYTVPVRADASTMPLGAEVAKVRYDFRPWQQWGDKAPDSAPVEYNPPGGGTGDGSGGGDAGAGDATAEPDATTSDATTSDDTRATGTTADDAATGAASAQQAGTDPGTGTGSSGTGTGTDSSAGGGNDTPSGDPTGYDRSDDDPAADVEQPTSLLSPAASVPVGAGGRGAGVSGVRGGAGQVASPLGMRQETAVARSTPAPSGAGATSSGARPSGPFGAPAAGAGGQRGQGNGRHRVPAYLIDRQNGEELVGDLPLVGPGVIGQWKPDGPPDAPRTAPPPAKAAPRPR
ncbi:hypothetical protein FK268_18365 [Tsukamurella sputi]|uniref:PPE domain-containing protein n=1 Tax=Tsukamurella sputi TaxID=2591848 RepID=A0A5C5RJR0_9ACTN|nr:hypothetical protein [Tsukamurella sputi]TWS22693.1 hypothetical protein FK268_18365 [Tsukamurella sputi]